MNGCVRATKEYFLRVPTRFPTRFSTRFFYGPSTTPDGGKNIESPDFLLITLILGIVSHCNRLVSRRQGSTANEIRIKTESDEHRLSISIFLMVYKS